MKSPFYMAIVVILVDISKVWLDATTSSKGTPWNYLGSINPVSLFRIVGLGLFLVFYQKKSKHGWVVLLLVVLVNVPLYWVLRWRGFYYEPTAFGRAHLFTLLVWLGFIVYIVKLRPRYVRYLSKQNSNHDGEMAMARSARLSEEGVCHVCEDGSLPKTIESMIVQPDTQIQIGKVGVVLALAYNIHCGGFYRLYRLLTVGLLTKLFFVGILYLAWGFILPAAYFLCLSQNKLRNAAILFRLWIAPLLVLFVFRGFGESILRGDFSKFMSLWGPFGVVSILFWIGQRGVRRNVDADSHLGDTLPDIFMYPGALCGFFLGGKIAHDFLDFHWPDMASYDVKWVITCLVGAFAGAFVCGSLGAWIAILMTSAMNGPRQKGGD